MTTLLMQALLAAVLATTPGRPAGAAGSAASTSPAPANEEELRSQIDAYLGSIDTPISPAQWQALGPQAVPILEQRAISSEFFPSRRARAIEALAMVGSSRQAPLLMGLARSNSEPFAVRAAALRSAAHLLPVPQAVAALRPLLEREGSPRIRAAAADALARSAGDEGCAAVQAQARREPPEHQDQFRRALRRCER